MPAAVFRRCLRAIVSPAGGIVAAAFGLLILLGCLSIGGTTTESHAPPEPDHVFQQEGELWLNVHEERDVYYPEPYVSPPYLELTQSIAIGKEYELLAQQPTHFRVRNLSSSTTQLRWKARGVRGKVTQVIAPGPPALPPTLPAEPVPVDPPAPPGKER